MTRLRINFVLPAYIGTPVGGYRVVYEYANALSARGHLVTVVFPRGGRPPSRRIGRMKQRLWPLKVRLRHRPLVPWYRFEKRVRLQLAPDIADQFVSDADVTVATGWETAHPVHALSPSKGAKFYLIQSYESWAGPEEAVDATWRLPLHKIVISKWLEEKGRQLGVRDLRHIPNGLDLRLFRVITPPALRPLSVLTLHHDNPVKGVPDALWVLERFHARFPEVPISMFGVAPRGTDVPAWVRYFENPDQQTLVRQVYNQHAVYLGASRLEGWALPPAEAMACGCAFVGTDIGGFRDYAIPGQTALLSAPGDREALLENLVRMTTDADLRRTLQGRGTEYIRQFTWEAAGASMEEYFFQCASR